MTQDEARHRATSIERHTQTILVLILVAILLWVGSTTQQTSVAIAAMSVQVGHVQSEIDVLQREVKKPDDKFREIEKRLDSIERQLSSLNRKSE